MDVSIITSTLVTSTVLLYILIPFPSQYCTAMDTLITSQNISKGQTLVSVGEVFELGFFSPGNSSKLYVGIWYKKTSTSKVVWVANREKPLAAADSSTSLTMGVDGNLRLMDGKLNTVWSTSIVPVLSNKQVAVLLDNGNLVIEDTVSKEKLWESMKNPCDTFLPGMMLGMNTRTGQKQFLTSWKSEDDPSPGNFLLGTKLQVPPQPFIWNGTTLFWRGGPWNGLKFIGMPEMDAIYQNGFRLVSDTREGTEYFTFDALGSSHIRIMFLSASGYLQISQWEEDRKEFEVHWETPQSPCDVYGMCGPYGVCNKNELPICKCLKGFKPKSSTEWSNGNWTGGCVRRTELFCDQNMKTSLASGRGRMDGFWKLSRMILPDLFENYMLPEDAEACSLWCLNNCSCTAYAFVAGIGCMIWTSDLMDIQEFSSAAEDLYLRLAYSELGRKNRAKLIFIVAAVSSFIILVALVYGLRKWKQNTTAVGLLGGKGKKVRSMEDINLFYNPDSLRDRPQGCNIERKDVTELPVIDMDQILVATANFSMANKLGEGGFGPVYKGKLKNGREVAVKRLSSSSVQGFEEFKTEIILISKLQHRNLVRLLGCCIGGEEKLLIYEYMPNKSLDTFLFDPTKRMQLDWAKRFNIIQGIARGLLYLHRDSCLRVIHRDLKASNILLDEHMDPKISDFGLARIFRRTQDLANTDRVVGTFGYMSPEYAMGGIFSEKSDVFSYGILLLEIVSSKKNTGFYYNEQHISILGHAWQLWSEHRELDLVDQALADTNSSSEAARCIHVALLCVQDHAVDRPTMSAVVLMLSGDSELSQPKQPTFSFQSSSDYDLPSQGNSKCSINEVTITTITGR